MTIAEMLLRLGCSLVAWMVVYAHCLWLATLRIVGCGPDGDAFWWLLLWSAPLAAGFALLVPGSARLPDLHHILRWGVVPLVVLIPLALIPVWSTFATVNLAGAGICEPVPGATWQRVWAPVQLTAIGVIIASALRAWRANTGGSATN